MRALQNIFWPFVALSALGAFIDFYIGPEGRKEATARLHRRWQSLDDRISASTFSQLEAGYFVELFDGIFGSRLLNLHRIGLCLFSVGVCFLLLTVLGYIYHSVGFYNRYVDWTSASQMLTWAYCALSYVITALSLGLSLSLTRLVSVGVARIATGSRLGILPFVVLLGVHFVLLIYWTPLASSTRFFLSNLQLPPMSMIRMVLAHPHLTLPPMTAPPKFESVPPWTDQFVGFFANAFRIVIAFAFLLALTFRKWLRKYSSRLMTRLKEEDPPKPYTRIFGALGAIAGALTAIGAHFSGSTH
jgi:hypothetical protein